MSLKTLLSLTTILNFGYIVSESTYKFIGKGKVFIEPDIRFINISSLYLCFIKCEKFRKCSYVTYDEEKVICNIFFVGELNGYTTNLPVADLQIFHKESPSNLRCLRNYEKIGCYKDNYHNRAISEVHFKDNNIDWDNWPDASNSLACKCAKITKEKGYTYFGLQFYGECWSSASTTYDKHGNSSDCVGDDYEGCVKEQITECVGKDYANYVYRLIYQDNRLMQQDGNHCSDDLCVGKTDGRCEFSVSSLDTVTKVTKSGKQFFDSYFTCTTGKVRCVVCPQNTFYVQQCDQCLQESRLEMERPCYEASPTVEATNFDSLCPVRADAFTMTECAINGGNFVGHIVDRRNNAVRAPTSLYIGCWNGKYATCMRCPGRLVFYEFKDRNGNFDVHGHCNHPPDQSLN